MCIRDSIIRFALSSGRASACQSLSAFAYVSPRLCLRFRLSVGGSRTLRSNRFALAALSLANRRALLHMSHLASACASLATRRVENIIRFALSSGRASACQSLSAFCIGLTSPLPTLPLVSRRVENIIPVSYTHLDVYKRQKLRHRSHERLCGNGCTGA